MKIAPIMKVFNACGKFKTLLVHTGQHYDAKMSQLFFDELNIPKPDVNLEVGSGSHAVQTAEVMKRFEPVVLEFKPDYVLVVGDVNSTIACGLVAVKLGIKLIHVEAGLRSFDRSMPEEINRFIVDHLSDFLFAPTAEEKNILIGEGVARPWIHVTGNSIVDAVKQSIIAAERRSRILERMGIAKSRYLLLTLHRQENVDSRLVFGGILDGLARVMRSFKLPIVFPMHPRTAKRMEHFGLKVPGGVRVTPPLGFLDFLRLEANAAMAFTDSGGVQEEACILRVPCVTLRNSTERPETVTVGSNVVAGTRPNGILRAARRMAAVKRRWRNPFGDGESSRRMLDILLR